MSNVKLTFEDALRIARGCTDYGGGYRCDPEQYEIYQDGIRTVIRALEAALERGLDDAQIRTLHSLGEAKEKHDQNKRSGKVGWYVASNL